jgi:hypothetical protein
MRKVFWTDAATNIQIRVQIPGKGIKSKV